MSHNARSSSWLVRSAELIGDLGNPFYAEERQRDVWNEASAVGLQLLLWLGMLAATAMVWLGGEESRPYVITFLVVIGFCSWATIAYAWHLGVDVTATARVLRWRMLPYLVLVAVLAVGLLRTSDEPTSPSTIAGAATGAAAAIVAAVVGGRRKRRLQPDLD